MSRNKLYLFVLVLCLTGYIWVFCNKSSDNDFLLGCLFHKVTNIPCPACGSTRAVLSMMHGNLKEAFFYNPLGIISGLCMILFPIWIIIDFLLNNNTFHRFYTKFEDLVRKKPYAWLLVFLCMLNWVWNIIKDI